MLEPAAGRSPGRERSLTAGSTRGGVWGRQQPQPSLCTGHKPCWSRARGLPGSLGAGEGHPGGVLAGTASAQGQGTSPEIIPGSFTRARL